MSNMLHTILLIGTAVSIAGCSTPSKPPTPPVKPIEWEPLTSQLNFGNVNNYTYIDGTAYAVNNNGEILIPTRKLEELKEQGVDVYHPNPIAGLELSERELNTLMHDKDALFVFLKNPDLAGVGEVAFPILKGSLRENLERFAIQSGASSFLYEVDIDYYIPEDSIVKATSKEQLTFVMLNGFPLEAEFIDGLKGEILRIYETGNRENRFAFLVEKGSWKLNAQRLADRAGWDSEWGLEFDYNVPQSAVIRGASYEDLMQKLIENYPINAQRSK